MVKPGTCAWCKAPLRGNATRFCSGPGTSCKQRQNAFEHSLARLAELPEPEFRELLKGVLRRRFGTNGRRTRFHLRFGEYREGHKDEIDRRLEADIERDALPGVGRVADSRGLHWWRPALCSRDRTAWSARALRVVARLLDRKTKEARRG